MSIPQAVFFFVVAMSVSIAIRKYVQKKAITPREVSIAFLGALLLTILTVLLTHI